MPTTAYTTTAATHTGAIFPKVRDQHTGRERSIRVCFTRGVLTLTHPAGGSVQFTRYRRGRTDTYTARHYTPAVGPAAVPTGYGTTRPQAPAAAPGPPARTDRAEVIREVARLCCGGDRAAAAGMVAAALGD
jgi:hypothetical protein